MGSSDSGRPSIARNRRTVIRNEMPTVAMAIVLTKFLGSPFPNTPLIAAQIRGRTGISQSKLNSSISDSLSDQVWNAAKARDYILGLSLTRLPLQQIAAIHIQRFAIAEHRDH